MMLVELRDELLQIAPYLVLGVVLELALNRHTLPWRGRGVNIAITFVYWAVYVVTTPTLAVVVGALLAPVPGHGILGTLGGSTPVGVLAGAVAFLVIADFFYYWMHRAQHAVPWLWMLHAVHHSDPHMNVTTTYRHHWLEKPLEALLVVTPIVYLLVISPAVFGVALALQKALGAFIHLDARVGLGGWNWICANPQHHRIHHSRDRQHFDVNFAAVWPVWDLLFGTYYRPGRGEFPSTGVIDYPPITGVWDASVAPLRAWRSRPASGFALSNESKNRK